MENKKLKKEALLIKQDGTRQIVSPKGKYFTLKELQGFVGGLIEFVYIENKQIMVVNEEGKLNGSLPNMPATEFITFDDIIFGDVLITSEKLIQ
jgi:hypothetical protein